MTESYGSVLAGTHKRLLLQLSLYNRDIATLYGAEMGYKVRHELLSPGYEINVDIDTGEITVVPQPHLGCKCGSPLHSLSRYARGVVLSSELRSPLVSVQWPEHDTRNNGNQTTPGLAASNNWAPCRREMPSKPESACQC